MPPWLAGERPQASYAQNYPQVALEILTGFFLN